MPNSISASGLTTATQAELLATYTAALQTIYGPDIDLDSDSPDGQEINIFIQAVLDLSDLLVQINNMFDPDSAIGVILDQRVAINGIQRLAGTYTIQNVTLYTTTFVPNLYGLDQEIETPYTVSDAAGNQYQLITSQTNFNPGGGGHTLSFQAVDIGNVQSAVGTITLPVTVVLGIGGGPAQTGIYNPSSYITLGLNEESDAALRVRRQQSVALSSQGYFASLLAALENINGIGSVEIYENDTDSTDARTIPSHSIWVVVQDSPQYPISSTTPYSPATSYNIGQLVSYNGIVYASGINSNSGNLPPVSPFTANSFWWQFDQVAWAIYLKRNAGCGMKGSTQVAVTQADKSVFVIRYDTVVTEPLWVAFYVTPLAAGTVSLYAAIQSGLSAIFVPGVNQEVNINALATAVQSIDPNTLVTFTGSGTPSVGGFSTADSGPFTNTLTPTAANNQFTLTAGQIIMLPMAILPIGPSVAAAFTQQFTPLGGYSPNQLNTDFTWSVLVDNSGGASISSSGLYTAGATPDVTDTVKCLDALGNFVTTMVSVT